MQSSPADQNGRIRRSDSEWRALLQRFSMSGQSAATFCESEGIPRSTFDLRRRKLQSKKPSPPKSQGEFVELTAAANPIGGWLIEIELPDGTMARLRS